MLSGSDTDVLMLHRAITSDTDSKCMFRSIEKIFFEQAGCRRTSCERRPEFLA